MSHTTGDLIAGLCALVVVWCLVRLWVHGLVKGRCELIATQMQEQFLALFQQAEGGIKRLEAALTDRLDAMTVAAARAVHDEELDKTRRAIGAEKQRLSLLRATANTLAAEQRPQPPMLPPEENHGQ